MLTKDVDKIFKLNNILISAFEGNEKLTDSLISENDSMTDNVNKTLLHEFKDRKSGKKCEPESDENPTFSRLTAYYAQGKYEECFWDSIRLYKENQELKYLKGIVLSLIEIKNSKYLLRKFIREIRKYVDKDPDVIDILANLYFKAEKWKEAFPIFKKLVKMYPNDRYGFSYNYKLSYIYERLFQDKKIDKQIEYAKKALDFSGNDASVLAFLAKLYHKKGDIQKSDECYKEAMKHNPNAELKIGYSHYLMNTGRITQGYDVYRARMDLDTIIYPTILTDKTRWDGKADLTNATIIVHYEQGFGDSIMFSRYVQDIAKRAKKTIFVIQKNIIPLLKSSGFEEYCTVLSHEADVNPNFSIENKMSSVMYYTGNGMMRIPHDWHIPLLDLPYHLKESPDKMLHSEGYLKADPEKIEKYRKKHIKKNNRIKIGFAYHGTVQSNQTYRDIPVKKLIPLFEMKELEFYSFQTDEHSKELKKLDKNLRVYNAAPTLKTFEDTACAMNCMDLIISTDNVVMNLAGALGIKTYGIFNVFPEGRWYKTKGEDIGWYKSVRPFQAKTFNDWDTVVNDIKSAIIKDFNL